MLSKRIIPCLDVMNGRAVKGVQFRDMRDAGDITALARKYSDEGADELVFLDITASQDQRKTMPEWVECVAEAVDIPFTVGGGITSEADVEALLRRGADKISVNSAALAEPGLIKRLAYSFGRQCVVLAVDAKQENEKWEVYACGGRKPAGRELFAWIQEAEALGAGEILFTSISHDGTREGYACGALAELSTLTDLPVIASGGAGCCADFYQVFLHGRADAALAAGIFHSGQVALGEVKRYLRERGVEVRF